MSEKKLARVIEFEGQAVPAVLWRDRWCWPAAAAGLAAGYKEGRIAVDKIRGEWREEFVEGKDYELLKGLDLKAFRDASSDSLEASAKVSQMLILTESGLDMMLVLARTAKGRRLRRMLVDYILPQLRAEGSATLPGAGFQLDAQALAQVVTAIVPQVVAAVVPEVLKAIPRPTATDAATAQALADARERLSRLEARIASGVIGPVVAYDRIVKPLRDLCAGAPGKVDRRLHSRYSTRLRNDLGFRMKGSSWAYLPHEQLHDAEMLLGRFRVEIEEARVQRLREDAARQAEARAKGRDDQQDLPFDKPN